MGSNSGSRGMSGVYDHISQSRKYQDGQERTKVYKKKERELARLCGEAVRYERAQEKGRVQEGKTAQKRVGYKRSRKKRT